MTEDQARQLFEDRILPAFQQEYQTMGDPDFFIIDALGVDGVGGPGIVGLSGLACQMPTFFVAFAIAHETAHGVVYLEHIKQGTHCPNAIGPDRKKHEAWADLIAAKVLMTRLPELWASVRANLDLIKVGLGGATETHPSGERRIELMRAFVAAYAQAGMAPAQGFLRKLFCNFGQRPVNLVQGRHNAFNAAFNQINSADLNN